MPSRAILARRFFETFTEGTRQLHLLAQGLHLGDGEAGIMSHDDHLGGLEDLLQRRDGPSFSVRVHKLSPVGGSLAETQRFATSPFRPGHYWRGRTALPLSLPPTKATPTAKRTERLEPVMGRHKALNPKLVSHPVMLVSLVLKRTGTLGG